MFTAALLFFSVFAQADVRERLIAKEERDRAAIASFQFTGYDASDAAVGRSAAHFCGDTQECQSGFLQARDALLRHAVIDRREKKVLKLLKANEQSGFVDWRLAERIYRNTYNPPLPPRSRTLITTCSTYSTKNSVHTRCASY